MKLCGICNSAQRVVRRGKRSRTYCVPCAKEYDRKRYLANPERQKVANRRWRLNNPQKTFEQQLKRLYDITPEDWARMYNDQDGRCAACMRVLSFDNNTHVDHSHETGRIRGLLCHSCNKALGNAKDNLDVLFGLVVYICERS